MGTVNDEKGEKGCVNWEDSNMNIGLPVQACMSDAAAGCRRQLVIARACSSFRSWKGLTRVSRLQVFIIHGNHDDPSGTGNFSALDELSTAGLLNYFGKQVLPSAFAGRTACDTGRICLS